VSARIEAIPVEGLPEVRAGDSVGQLIASALEEAGEELEERDVVVVSQKVVSKAEGRTVDLADVEPGKRSVELATRLGKDPRLVELILRESAEIVRAEREVLIVEGRTGLISANAGIDASNVPGDDRVTLLPIDPDASARRLRAELRDATGVGPGVIVADSFGRPWRLGQVEVAIGCAGIAPLDDWRGRRDRDGEELAATVVAAGDELASAADLVRGKDEGIPVVLVRGAGSFVSADDGPGASALLRPRDDDLFR
jgi:coenzyme F420-0:L-glutamate ligase/coenzyme F420-1:gamma-L-glutamate ligase